jgi:hypothetical protein
VTGASAACLVCSRADFLAVAGNVELRSIPGYPALARRFAGAGRPVHARLGGGAIELHPRDGGAVRGRFAERSRDLGAAVAATPVGRAVGLASWGVALLAAPALLLVAGDPWWPTVILYAACVVQVAVFLARLGNFGWPTALLYPVPLLGCVGVLAVGLVRSRR